MATTHDVLILGHGLAGAAFAVECLRRGMRVAVFADDRAGQASRVAAGVVNPVVLRRYVSSWRAKQMLPFAENFYRQAEARAGRTFWHPLPMHALFADAASKERWQQQAGSDELRGLLDPVPRSSGPAAGIAATHGYGAVGSAAWLDVPAYLAAQREQLTAQATWVEGTVNEEAIIDTSDAVRIGDCTAPLLVRCQGPFAALPGLVPVKGETLTLHMHGLSLPGMVHRGVFMLPIGNELFRVGATFKWTDVWEGITDEAQAWLLERAKLLVTPEFRDGIRVVEHGWGVRPAARDRRPLLGRLSATQAVLNGLGARGVLLAPWCATHLAAHIFDGEALDPEVDRARYTRIMP